MSFESALHELMVRRIVREVRQAHSHLYSFTVYADLLEFGRNKPRRIGGYVPDVLAYDVPETCRVVGEAKTPADFETARSQRQITSFLSHLAAFPDSYFYLAVPWPYARRANIVLKDRIGAVGAHSVQVQVVTGL